MNARNEIKYALLVRKMKYWLMVARNPSVYRHCPSSRARKNYWRLIAKYPEIAAQLNLNPASVYTA